MEVSEPLCDLLQEVFSGFTGHADPGKISAPHLLYRSKNQQNSALPSNDAQSKVLNQNR
ncbi:hypothetical protein [Panacagrimonas sp.]|uniref:hypothetical protein n=1 Tax=Panacagrimonas sp. TaxID=2480088 RepID=UPI003B522FB3